jgi:hypothetical protein
MYRNQIQHYVTITSGATYGLVPHRTDVHFPFKIPTLDKTKSASLQWPSLSKSTLLGFMSLQIKTYTTCNQYNSFQYDTALQTITFIPSFRAEYTYIYTGCPRRNVPDFGRVFLMLKYTDITQNTYIQS